MAVTRKRRFRSSLAAVYWALLLAPGVARPDELRLKPETVKAWDGYVQTTESGLQARLTGKTPFLWMDESVERWRRVRRGEILVFPQGDNGRMSVPHGIIHHWVGAVFIPGAP